MGENATGNGILNPVVLFMLAVVAVVKLVEYAVSFALLISSFFVYFHEALHLGVAYILGVEAVEQGFQDDENIYEIQFAPHTPEQGFLIKFAPLLLVPVSFLLMYIALQTPYSLYIRVPVFIFAFFLATHSLPSDIDAFGVFIDVSRVSPVSSIVSSLLAIPFAIIHLPALLFGVRWVFLVQFCFAILLSYLAFSVHLSFLHIALGVIG